MSGRPLLPFVALCFVFCLGMVQAGEIRIAVASNFAGAMRNIAHQFEQDSGHKVTLLFGSTGKQYAQIVNGAPLDAFFAADMERPALLEKQARIQPGSRSTYAFGDEHQRVAIARTLAVSLGILLMDEPLPAIDEERKQEIMPWLESLHDELEIPLLHISHSRMAAMQRP